MRKIFQALLLINLCLTQLTAHAINSKEQNFTQDLASAALAVSTTFSITDAGFLSLVSLHFSAAPASAETIQIWRDSRAGVNYDTLLATYVTIAGTSTDVSFVFGNVIPIAETDQIRVTCTNDSVGDPTVSVSVVLDPAVRNGSGVSIYDNGALKISQYQHDYHWHFGDVIPGANQEFGAFYSDFTELSTPADPAAGTRRLFVDSGTGELSVRTSASTTVSLEGSSGGGHEIQEEGVGLAQEPILNFTGSGVTCTAGTGETVCDIPTPSGTGHEIQDEGVALANETVLNFTGDGVTCTEGTGETVCDVPSNTLSSPWVYLILGSDFTTTSGTAVTLTGLGFTPLDSTQYDIRAQVLLRTATAAQGPRLGVAYPTAGLTDGISHVRCGGGTASETTSNGNIAAAHQCLQGSLPDTTGSWPSDVIADLVTTTGVTGTWRLTLHAETAGTTVTAKAGSWLAYRVINAGVSNNEVDPTLTNDGAVIVGSGAVNPTVLTFNSDAGTDGTISYNGTTDIHTVGPGLTVAPGILGATDVATTVTTRLGQKMGLDNSANYGGAAFTTWSNTNADHSPFFEFNRSRSDTLGTHTVVTNGDTLGYVVFRGSDGTAFQNSSFIQGSVDGVPGASDMPGRLRFFTAPDGSATPVERLRIDSAGHVRTAGTAPTLSACGTTPTILGNDVAGKVTTGTGVITSCTLTFDTAWTSAPACTVNDETAIQLTRAVSTTTTLTITSATAITSQVISYICIGRV